MNIKDYLEQKRIEVDRFLDTVCPPATTPPTMLHESMRYSLLAGGKRVRPILAMAVLAGDALLTKAFDLCSHPDLMKGCDSSRRVRLIQELAYGSGNMGMVGGQVFDIQAENKEIDLPTLRNIHKHKTGMLIRAAVRMGAIAGGATDRELDHLTGYAEHIGLAFQIADDILNVTGTPEELGKNPNTDAQRGKKTYPSFYGVDGARNLANECVARAIRRLNSFGSSADPLRELARYITARKN